MFTQYWILDRIGASLGKEIGISWKFVRPNTHSRKDNNECEGIIEGGRKIYAGDKFKTHVLEREKSEERRRRRMSEHKVAVLIQIYCLFIVCYSVCFPFVWSRPTARPHAFTQNTMGFDPVILVTAWLLSPFFLTESQSQAGGFGPDSFIRGLARFTGIINVKLAGGQWASGFPLFRLLRNSATRTVSTEATQGAHEPERIIQK